MGNGSTRDLVIRGNQLMEDFIREQKTCNETMAARMAKQEKKTERVNKDNPVITKEDVELVKDKVKFGLKVGGVVFLLFGGGGTAAYLNWKVIKQFFVSLIFGG